MEHNSKIAALAKRVDQAARSAQPIQQLSADCAFDLTDAYAIQEASIRRREDRGESVIGVKLGFTSKAKMEQMGVHDMIWGRLTDAMHVADGAQLSMTNLIHPRAEPEICFRVCKPINRVISRAELPGFIDGVASAIEVIDSRYEHFKFSLEDVIADNCSSAAFVVGPWQDPATHIKRLDISLLINGQVVHAGSTDAILGDPWESVIAAARLASQYGFTIPEGGYLLAGAATPATYLQPDQTVQVKVAGMPGCSFSTIS